MRRGRQEGFTLIEAMIALLIIGLISIVVARLFKGGMQAWIFSNANINNQQRVRVARDMMVKSLRQAQAGSIEISSYGTGNPPMSMITYINSEGTLKQAYFQDKGRFYRGSWEWTDTTQPYNSTRTVTPASLLIPTHLRQMVFFYPNMKDDRNISFSLYSVWPLPDSVANDSEVYLVGDVEVRNP